MKYSVLITKTNVVYMYAPCNYDGNMYTHSIGLSDEAKELGCRSLMVDEMDIPTDMELGDCYFDEKYKEFKFSNEKKEWREVTNLRNERMDEFVIGDVYQLPYKQSELTDIQKEEYSKWRKAWLDVTETKVKPTRPNWMN